MPGRDEALSFARRVHALSGGLELRRKAVARDLAVRHPADVTELIHHLLLLNREGVEVATCVLQSLVAALGQDAAEIPHAKAFERLATVQDLNAVAALFAQGPPREQMDPRAAAKKDAVAVSDSLGHQKTKARTTTDPDVLSRLAMSHHPAVVHNVLKNPRLTEALVVRMAARRPTRPEPLEEIWKSPRWSVRHGVRRALAFNPYLPPSIGAKVLPLLNLADLRELGRDAAIHPALREQARLLLEQAKLLGLRGP